VVSESTLSHQVEVEVLPFRETFSVLFFVSVGMLVNPLQFITNGVEVLVITALIIVGKGLLTLVLGLLLARSMRVALVIAVSLAQIGEFSFLLGQAGLTQGILTQDQYSLLLVGSLISITLNPFLFRLLPRFESALGSLPGLRSLREERVVVTAPLDSSIRDHVVVVGYGRVGRHLVDILTRLKIPCLVVEVDVGRITELERRGVPVLFGDAGNSEILSHAHLSAAREVVITVPDEVSSANAVAAVREIAPHTPLVVRASTQEGIGRLVQLGATDVIYPELAGSLEIMQRTLARLGFSEQDIQVYAEAVRGDHYDLTVTSEAEEEALARMRSPISN
jgi:CPA2 family monovalent cation:H+ antiporter-2